MIGGENDFKIFFGDFAEEVERRRVAEPRLGNGAVGGLRGGELTNHFGFGASMGKHIDEIEHADIELVILDLREVLNESFAECRFVDFIVRECISFAEPVEQCLNEGSLVQVFSFLFVLVYPQVGEHASYLVGQQPGEDSVAGILRGCGQDTEIEVFLGRKVFVKQRFDYSPLVETEIVDEYEKYFLPVVDEGGRLWF